MDLRILMLINVYYFLYKLNITMEHEDHKHHLKNLCIICGMKLNINVQKLCLVQEILDVYGLNVEDEDDEIYPTNICNNHCTLLYCARNCRTKGSTFSTSVSNLPLFKANDELCKICYIHINDGGHAYLSFEKISKYANKSKRRCADLVDNSMLLQVSFDTTME